MAFSVSQFRSKGIARGGARPNLFQTTLTNVPAGVPIPVGSSEGGWSFVCKIASIPASTVAAVEVPYFGRQVKVPGNRTFADWTITILNDNQYSVRNAFEEWSNLINSHDGNVGPASLGEIFQTWQVEQLDQSGNTIKTYEFQGCWPIEVGAIDLSADANDTIEEYTVTIAYQFWTSDTTS